MFFVLKKNIAKTIELLRSEFTIFYRIRFEMCGMFVYPEPAENRFERGKRLERDAEPEFMRSDAIDG